MRSTGKDAGTGPFWGARYTRTWFTTLALLPLLWGVYVSLLAGTGGWVVLVPLAVVVVALVWLVPQSVVGHEGVRLVLGARLVRWSEIVSVLDPAPGDEDARVEVDGGRVVRLPGVPPRSVPALRALLAAHR